MTMEDLIRADWGGGVIAALDGSVTTHHRLMADPVIGNKTVEGLLVPWDRPTWVADDLPNGTRKTYREGFRRTAVDQQLFSSEDRKRCNPGRVMFRHMHSRTDGFGPLGIGRNFEVRDEGLWGEFHIIEDKRSTLADLVQHGISGLSVEFRERPGGSEEDEDGVVWRTEVLLNGVALEWAGAYPEAQVLAMRAEVDDSEREQAAAEAEARERAEAEAVEQAAAAAAEQARLDEAAELARKQVEVQAWVAEQERKQAELAALYK